VDKMSELYTREFVKVSNEFRVGLARLVTSDLYAEVENNIARALGVEVADLQTIESYVNWREEIKRSMLDPF
jgi:hypothetical protein